MRSIWHCFFIVLTSILSLTELEMESSNVNSKSLILMQNFNPDEWMHVRVNLFKIEEFAHKLVTLKDLKIADWTEIIPEKLSLKERVEYIMGLICIDFCHWAQKKEGKGISNFYAIDDQGKILRGSSAMTFLTKKTYENGLKIFDANFMKNVTADALRPYFMGEDEQRNPMEIPWLEDRIKVMNEVGHILMDKWEGSFYTIFQASKSRIFNRGKGFIELLIRDFPRFKDAYIYKGKEVGIYKLAQLSVMALQSTCRALFKDCEKLTLCADYQLPKALRALEILEYSPELISYVDQERLIPYGSDLEIELRMATLYAGYCLKEKVNKMLAKEGRSPITSQELDYLLWEYGRTLNPHMYKQHLTLTIMY